MNCILCKKEIFGFGNNSLSLKNGEFYDECNRNKVLPERLFLTGMNDKQILVVDAENDWLKLENLKGKEVSLKRLQQLVDGYIQLYQKSVPKFFYIVNEKRGGFMNHLKIN